MRGEGWGPGFIEMLKWEEDVNGELSWLLDTPILMADEAQGETGTEEEYGTEYRWTFYRFATRKGYVDLRFLGLSNGWYSEKMDFIRIPESLVTDQGRTEWGYVSQEITGRGPSLVHFRENCQCGGSPWCVYLDISYHLAARDRIELANASCRFFLLEKVFHEWSPKKKQCLLPLRFPTVSAVNAQTCLNCCFL